ncbi:MAG: hypothetical protein IT349_20590 [Candidatus Eisenbacteria bacterium]|nr:hypothetical protein [Candidatus Eisenbacteria bacterium]
MKSAATRLVEEVHARVAERAGAQGKSIAEYLEALVLADLAEPGRPEGTSAPEAGTPSTEVLGAQACRQHAELLALIHKLGELTYLTRAAFFNFVLAWSQVQAGRIDPGTFDWMRWCDEQLTPRGGGPHAENRPSAQD